MGYSRSAPAPQTGLFGVLELGSSGDLGSDVTVMHPEAMMLRPDWLTIVWGLSTMFLSALLAYVLLSI
jgi:hypothetical protein